MRPTDLLALVTGVLVLVALEAGAESQLALWANERGQWLMLCGGVVLYAVVGLVFALVLRYGRKSLATANALWQSANIVVVTIISVIAFGKPLSAIEWMGIVLAILASACFLM